MKWYSTPSVSWFFLGRLVSVKEKPDREHLKLRLCESLLELKLCWSEPCSHAATCRSPQHQQLLMTTKPKEVQGKISSLRSPFKKKGARAARGGNVTRERIWICKSAGVDLYCSSSLKVRGGEALTRQQLQNKLLNFYHLQPDCHVLQSFWASLFSRMFAALWTLKADWVTFNVSELQIPLKKTQLIVLIWM